MMLWVALLILLSGATAWAQERQVVPLCYELWWDPHSFVLIGLRQLPALPEVVKVPSLPNAQFFTHKFVDGERVFILAKEGDEFILYADTDGDNDLTDERPFRLGRRGHESVFGPIPMRFRVNGKTVLRHIGVRLFLFPGAAPLYLLISCLWRGTVLLGDKPTPVAVMDANGDGIIDSDDHLFFGKEQEWRFPLPTVGHIAINGQFWRYRVAPTGEELVMEPVSVPRATVRFQGERLELIVENKSGRWMLEGQGGQLIAPIGEFQLMRVQLFRKDKQGRLWRLVANAFGPAAPQITFSPSGTTLNIEPLKVGLIYNRNGQELEFSLEVKTANGMAVGDLSVDDKRPPEPRLRLVAGGRVVDEPQFHYG